MKKFLTMLLALSVVFTYTVGTAFAVPATAEQKSKLVTELGDAKDAALKSIRDYDETADDATKIAGLTISKADYEAVINQAYNDYLVIINIVSARNDFAEDAADFAVIDKDKESKKYADMDIDDILGTDPVTGVRVVDPAKFTAVAKGEAQAYHGTDDTVGIYTYKVALARHAFPAESEKALAEIEKLDLSVYADVEMSEADFGAENNFHVTYAEKAAEAKEALIKKVKDNALKDTDLITTAIEAKVNNIKAAYKCVYDDAKDASAPLRAVDYKADIYGDKVVSKYALNKDVTAYKNIKTKDDLAGEEATDTANKAALKAAAATKAAAYIAIAKDKAAAKAETEAYLEVQNTLIDAGKIVVPGGLGTVDNSYIALVEAYKVEAEKVAALKLEKNLDGVASYDAAKLDEILAENKVNIYNGDPTKGYGSAKYTLDTFKNRLDALVAALELAKNDEVNAVVGVDDKYYDLEKAQVAAVYDKAIEKVKAAKDGAQLTDLAKLFATVKLDTTIDADWYEVNPFDATFAKNAGAELPKTAAQVEKVIKTDEAATYTNEVRILTAYVNDVVNADAKAWNDNYRDATVALAGLDKFYAANGARKADEIKALRAKAQEMLAALPTKAELEKAKADAAAAEKALPNYITLENKEQVAAAYEAYVLAYGTNPVASTKDALGDKLAKAIAAVKKAETDALDEMVAKLPAKNVTAATKAEAQAIFDAIVAYEDSAMYGVVDYTTDENDYAHAIVNADKKAVTDALGQLSNHSSKEDVEAARALYDGYVEALAKLGILNNIAPADTDKLLLVEAQLKVNEIKAVESLKVKASSKAYKGAIRVNWTAKGDKDAVDGYEVFRSVKKNSGFGTKAYFKTTKTTYKNTKALKKGKRYYYKVRAYKVVDGKKYYSDWSNKAYRVAK